METKTFVLHDVCGNAIIVDEQTYLLLTKEKNENKSRNEQDSTVAAKSEEQTKDSK